MDLTFAEQIKVLLNREHMTIKEFAEQIEAQTGTACSRQNLTQKLKRDNFQEKDMRMLAAVLGCKVKISLESASPEEIAEELAVFAPHDAALDPMVHQTAQSLTRLLHHPTEPSAVSPKKKESAKREPAAVSAPLPPDCINPYTQEEYLTNTVRKHPELEHYIQVYDRSDHSWTDVAEDYFLKFQEQKRQMMGKDYALPIYI